MKIIKTTVDFMNNKILNLKKKRVEKLISYLKELERLEAKLWGIDILNIQTANEKILENTNHLIYILSKANGEKELKNKLMSKEIKEFEFELRELKNDFNYLKKKIKEKNELKFLISTFTIKIVESKTYSKMKKIFLLEKKLYALIEEQDLELEEEINKISKIKFNSKEEKADYFVNTCKNIRKILAGHEDLQNLWEKERIGYSNTSNIIYELIKNVKEIFLEGNKN